MGTMSVPLDFEQARGSPYGMSTFLMRSRHECLFQFRLWHNVANCRLKLSRNGGLNIVEFVIYEELHDITHPTQEAKSLTLQSKVELLI